MRRLISKLGFILVFSAFLAGWLLVGLYVSDKIPLTIIESFLNKFIDLEWWVESTITFAIFTLIFKMLINLKKSRDEREFRKPYEDWSLVSIYKQEKEDQELYWDEVMRFEQSDFERWKFVKSVVSGVGQASLRTVKRAEESEWVMIDKDKKTIIIDLDKSIELEHVTLYPSRTGSVANGSS